VVQHLYFTTIKIAAVKGISKLLGPFSC